MNLKFRGLIANIFLRFCWLFPLQDKIVFSSYDGSYFNDNPAAVYKALLEKNSNLKYVWLMKDAHYTIEGASVVKVTSFRAIYELATAKCWVDNKRKQYWLRKRKGQYYVQLWHGGIALKKVEKDAAVVELGDNYVTGAINDSEMADLFVSGSRWRSNNFRNSFWYNGDILECGSPKSDIFFKPDDDIKRKVCEYYHLDVTTNFILYAPTFRSTKRMDCYDLDLIQMMQACKKKWGGNWKALIRLHPNIQNQMNEFEYNEDILNGSLYSDVNELIIASNIVVTDYSSVMFDGLAANKTVMLYVKDADDYQQKRGLYWKIEDLPFLRAYNNADAISEIDNFSIESYSSKINQFKDELGIIPNDHASEIVANVILHQLNFQEDK